MHHYNRNDRPLDFLKFVRQGGKISKDALHRAHVQPIEEIAE